LSITMFFAPTQGCAVKLYRNAHMVDWKEWDED
jgi:hypothetical protein